MLLLGREGNSDSAVVPASRVEIAAREKKRRWQAPSRSGSDETEGGQKRRAGGLDPRRSDRPREKGCAVCCRVSTGSGAYNHLRPCTDSGKNESSLPACRPASGRFGRFGGPSRPSFPDFGWRPWAYRTLLAVATRPSKKGRIGCQPARRARMPRMSSNTARQGIHVCTPAIGCHVHAAAGLAVHQCW